MIYYKDGDYTVQNVLVNRRGRLYDDNIYTLDIETTSIFEDQDGHIIDFNYKKKPDFYKDLNKMGFMYVWQFSINADVYYGRTWPEFVEFLTALKSNIQGRMIIYVHNLGFEFQFLRNVIDDFEVFARQPRHPITARSDKYNCEFRCSLMLTNSKLENLPKMYDLPVEKMTGDLDYSLRRTSNTTLTEKELSYCEHDCLVVYELIKKFRERYKTVSQIPLTQTGTLRRECQKMYSKNYKYKKQLKKQLPANMDELKYLMKAFSGGYTHANHYYTGDILKYIRSMDITSSYPTVMLSEKYPCTRFFTSNVRSLEELDPDYNYIVDITFADLYSVTDNTYLSLSKSLERFHAVTDNGRIQSAERIRYILTEVDIDIIKQCYKWTSYEIREARRARSRYLDTDYVKKILELYNNKTKYKGIPEKSNEYLQSKQYINSLYGMMVTNLITDTTTYGPEGWGIDPLTADGAEDKLQKINEDRKTFLSQAWGVYVTAYARRNLWAMILKLDHDVIYCDTDSVKFRGDHAADFDIYNNEITEKLEKALEWHRIDKSLLHPKDSKGVEHPLGVYDPDESYKEFITLGAKKYCYKNSEGKIGITVSGVNKCGAKSIKTLKDFRDGHIFDYYNSGKKMLTYNDDQDDVTVIDYQGHTTKVSQKYGINLMPTEYTLGISVDYQTYINDTLHYRGLE